jgi:putative hydrolase of HD superfamily
MLAMAPEWVDLFDEYESASTAEAKFVKTMDKLDMGLQAIRYTEQDIDLSEFISSARNTTDKTDLAYLLE